MNKERFATIFNILSNKVRLCILWNLYKEGEKRVTDLQNCTNVSQSLVSQQLSKLKDLQIISARREGNYIFYKLEDEKITKILSVLENEGEFL